MFELISWPADDAFPGVTFTRESLEDPAEFAGFAEFLAAPRSPRVAAPVDVRALHGALDDRW